MHTHNKKKIGKSVTVQQKPGKLRKLQRMFSTKNKDEFLFVDDSHTFVVLVSLTMLFWFSLI